MARSGETGAALDLRGLFPPAPMVAILRAIETGSEEVTAWLDREPVHLYPELAARGWRWELSRQAETFVLRLRREDAA